MTWLLLRLIDLYRITLGRVMGGHCRFYPTCSQYAKDAITQYGPWKGSTRALRRILRCHPFGPRGFDPA